MSLLFCLDDALQNILALDLGPRFLGRRDYVFNRKWMSIDCLFKQTGLWKVVADSETNPVRSMLRCRTGY
jgi:hypothetical protein